jgi:hypothetical protein
MSPLEFAGRARRIMRKQHWRSRYAWDAPSPHLAHKDPWNLPLLETLPREEREALLAEADRYLHGDYRLLNLSFHEAPMNWHRDPQTGIRAPEMFALDLDFLDTKLVGNIKYLWEKNRHHHLTVLAAAYALSREERYAEAVKRQLESWLEQNPIPIGVNWASPLEMGIRLISWAWIDRLLRGSPARAVLFGPEGVLWPAIYWQQWMTEQNYSHGSSANNHLVGEMAGLYISASVWPVFPKSIHWRKLSRRKLEQEILNQTFPSGINCEMAFDYHIFTLQLFLLAYLEADRHGSPFSAEYRARLTRMLEVIPLLADAGGNLPRYGDGDDGIAVQLGASSGRPEAWLCRVGRAKLNANVPVSPAGRLPAALLGVTGQVESEWSPPAKSIGFEDAGLFVLARDRGTPQEIFVLADAGPHGYPETGAHAHADALSFAMSVAGQPIFVDPGTFDYLMDEHWRNYFRGAMAHNTAVVDALDQSTPAGPFLWSQKAAATVHAWAVNDTGAKLIASHNGYKRIGVSHRRTFELQERALLITDELQGLGEHEIRLAFHLASECEVEQILPGRCKISRVSAEVHLTLPDTMEASLVRGGRDAGWISPCYGVKQPTCTIVARARLLLPCSLRTLIEVKS